MTDILKGFEKRLAKQIMTRPERPSLEERNTLDYLHTAPTADPTPSIVTTTEMVNPQQIILIPSPQAGPEAPVMVPFGNTDSPVGPLPQAEPASESHVYYLAVMQALDVAAQTISDLRDQYGGRISQTNRGPDWLNYQLPGGPSTNYNQPGSSARVQNQFLGKRLVDVLDNATYVGTDGVGPVDHLKS